MMYILSVIVVFLNVQVNIIADGQGLQERMVSTLQELMGKVMNMSIVEAINLKFATKVMVDKVDDNLKLNGKYTNPDKNDTGEQTCHEFIKKYKGKTFPVYEDLIGNATLFIKDALNNLFEAKYCKTKGFMETMVCLMRINNHMQGEFQVKYNQLAPLDKLVNRTMIIVGTHYLQCLKYLEKLPKMKQPYDDLKKAIDQKTLNRNVPCQITLAIVNNETGEVKGAPCYSNMTKV